MLEFEENEKAKLKVGQLVDLGDRKVYHVFIISDSENENYMISDEYKTASWKINLYYVTN